MAGQNNFWIDLVAALQKSKSKKQVQSDAKNLGDIKVPLIGTLNKSKTKAQLKQDLSSINGTVNLNAKVNGKGVVQTVQQTANRTPIQMNVAIRKEKLINDIKILGQQNSKLFKDSNMATKYHNLLSNAQLATSAKDVERLRLQLAAMNSELKANNLSGLTLGDTFKKTFKRATELFAGTGGVMLLSRLLREAWTEALQLDKAYTDLIKVQDELSRSDYPEYLERCNKKAQELATSQKSLIESTEEFSKSGYNLTESNALSEKSTILSNVGEMSAPASAKAIISGVQAYDLIDGYDDAVNKAGALIDKYNEIGNIASITTAEIAEGVQSVGSVFADSNTSVDEFIAMLAAGNRQFQNADSLALGLRTSALRIRGCTTELEAMNEETDGVITSTSKLEKQIKALTNVNGSGGVEILEADGETFRSIYDIFVDISKVYKQMSDVDASALLELISGKHRASAISAVLNNMSEAQELYQRSLEATGSAQREYDEYMLSSEASLNKFKASMTETYQRVINGESAKDILDTGNAVLKFANSLGLVESTIRGLIGIGLFKGITTLSVAFKASAIQASNFGTALNTVKNMSGMARGTTEYVNALNNLKSVASSLSATQLKQVLSSKALSDADRIAILRTTGLTKAQAQAKLAQMGLTTSTNAQTAANTSATASTFGLSAAVKGLGTNLKLAFMSNPVGISIMALSAIFGAVSTKVSEYNEKMRETRQANMDAATSASEKANELSDLYVQYEQLNSIQNKTTSEEEQFKTVVKNITKVLGDKAEALHGLTVGTDEYSESLKNATKAELENQYATAKIGAKAAEDELKDKTWSNLSGSQITIQQNEQMTGVKEHVAALNEVKDILSKFEDESLNGIEWEPINFDTNKDDMDAVVEYYNALLEARNKLATSDNADFLMSSDIYRDINTTINELSESVENYTKQKYESLKLEYMWQNGIPATEEEFQKMKESILGASGAGERFQNVMKDFIAEDFSEFGNSIDNLKNQLENSAEVQPPIFDSSAFMDEVSKIQEGYDKLIKAKTEFDEYGAITASTLKDLTDNNLIQYLEFTADGLSVNTTALEANEQALKDAATAELYNAMCADIQNLALGDTGTLSDIAQTAIANLDSAATTAGENAAIAATGWWEYGASIQSIPGVENLVGDNVKKAEAIVGQYKKIANSINSISIGKTNSSRKSSSNKAKDAEKSAKEASEKAKKYATEYIKYQDRLLDNGKIDYNTYCNSVQNMLDDLYNSGKITAEEYFGYVEQKLNKQFEVYKKALSAITKRIQKEADKWKDKIDALQEENELLEKQKDKYDSILRAVEKVYDDEIDKLNEQKDAIQDVIDAMEDENDEYERQMALQQAIYNFNRAMNQKTKMVYKDGQMVWDTDSSAIRDSQDEMKDAQHNIDIAELEKKQDDLDKQIENLQKYKEMWQEVANAYQQAQDDMNAKAMWGQNYAEMILQNNINDIEEFKNQYVAIDQEIQDNTLLIESYEEKVEYYENLKEKWEEVATAYEDEQERQCAAMLLGQDWEKLVLEGRTETLEGFKEGYVGIQTKIAEAAEASAERTIRAAEKAMAALNNLIAAANAAANIDIPAPPKNYYDYNRNDNKTGSFLPPGVKKNLKYGTGTTNAKKGLNLVGETNEPEIFIDNDDNASLVTEPTLIPMEGGETVKNPDETKKILGNDNLIPLSDSDNNFYSTIKKPEGFEENLTRLYEKYSNGYPMQSFGTYKPKDFGDVVNNIDNSNNVTMEVNINCPNVTNDSGAEYLKREIRMLTTKVMQR